MKIDAEARRIDIAIREAIASGSALVGSSHHGRLGRLRARWGTEVHARYRQVHEALGAEGEVAVHLTRSHRGWTVHLHGRADLVSRQRDRLVVDEVKSTLATAACANREPGEHVETEAALGPAALDDARRQVLLYALALDANEHVSVPVIARVVVVAVSPSPSDETADVSPLAIDDAGYERATAEALLAEVLASVVTAAERAEGTAERRRAAAAGLRFPYDAPRPHQAALAAFVAGALDDGRPALLEAPTGIGKTVAALLPALRFALSRGATCFFATAKTTQRQGVAQAFTALAAAAEADVPLHALTLRRRDQMCPPGHLRCHPDTCDLLADFERRLADSDALARLLGAELHIAPEAIFAVGRAEALCPFELMQRLEAEVDLVIGDYNHRFDPAAPSPRPAVVVIDEAHNLVDRARDAASPFVGKRGVDAAERCAMDHPELAVRDDVSAFARALRRAIDDARREAAADDDRVPVDGCLEQPADAERWRRLAIEAEAVGLSWLRGRHRRPDVMPFPDPVVELVEVVRHFARQGRRVARSGGRLVPYVAGPRGPSGPGVGLCCVDPASELEPRHRGALGTIAMSATLSPASYYTELLGLARLDPVTTSVPSPFPIEHRAVIAVPTIDTTYDRRDDELPRVAELIERVIATRPGHYAAFFPSHAVLQATRRHLQLPAEQLLVQPPMAPSALRDRILRTLREDPRPRLLLAVTGGVFAEGVDLPGEALVGAIIVGPTLPPPTFTRLLIQRHFDERHGDLAGDPTEETATGFAYAYVYPGLRRVVQAAGRVVRTPTDRGVILLVGRRFSTSPYLDVLPPHWYRHDPRELAAPDPIARLQAFWAQADDDPTPLHRQLSESAQQ